MTRRRRRRTEEDGAASSSAVAIIGPGLPASRPCPGPSPASPVLPFPHRCSPSSPRPSSSPAIFYQIKIISIPQELSDGTSPTEAHRVRRTRPPPWAAPVGRAKPSATAAKPRTRRRPPKRPKCGRAHPTMRRAGHGTAQRHATRGPPPCLSSTSSSGTQAPHLDRARPSAAAVAEHPPPTRRRQAVRPRPPSVRRADHGAAQQNATRGPPPRTVPGPLLLPRAQQPTLPLSAGHTPIAKNPTWQGSNLPRGPNTRPEVRDGREENEGSSRANCSTSRHKTPPWPMVHPSDRGGL